MLWALVEKSFVEASCLFLVAALVSVVLVRRMWTSRWNVFCFYGAVIVLNLESILLCTFSIVFWHEAGLVVFIRLPTKVSCEERCPNGRLRNTLVTALVVR